MTYRGETVGNRIDSYYYQAKFRTLDQIVESVRFDVVNLGVLISDIASGITPKVDEDYYTDSSGIPFLRVQNVTSQGIDLSDVKFIKREVHEGMLKRAQLKKDDLVFTITGRIGSVAVVPDNFEGNINQHSVRFHLKEQVANININPHYVSVFLNSPLGRSLAIREVTGGTRPALDYKALYSLKIILPPLDIQNHIVEIMQAAYAQKKQKEQEADTLLDSIDDYVLAELGIEMPAVEEKKCFVVYANERAGRRIDSYYHLPYFKKLYSVINNYDRVFSLRNLVSELDYGLMPTQDYADSGDTGVPMIRVTNLLQDGSIDMSEVKYIPFDTPRLDLKRVKADDILMVQCGNTTGKTALVSKSFENYTFGSFLFVIRGKKEIINQRYLLAILSNRLIQEQIRHTWNIVTVRPNTSKPNVQNLLIPVPAPEIQDRIADEVMIRKSKATKLRQEADAIVAEAKREVERVMLEGVSG